MELWRKLTLDWPCALGDFLWWTFVTAPKASLKKITLSRALIFCAFFFLACLFARMGSFDFAFLLGGDTIFYLEIVSAVMLAAARGHIRVAVRAIMRQAGETVRSARVLVRHRLGARQRRSSTRRKLPPQSSDDEPAVAGWAFARWIGYWVVNSQASDCAPVFGL